MKDVSITILNLNTPRVTVDCIESIIKYTKDISYEIILVDNGSTDNSRQIFTKKLSKFNSVKVFYTGKNLGFGKGHNKAIQQAKGKYLLILNCDILFSENSLKTLREEFKRLEKITQIGFVQPRLFKNSEKTQVQETCARIPSPFNIIQENFPFFQKIKKNSFRSYRYSDWDRNSSRYVEAVCGAAMFCRKDFFTKIGLFDERFFSSFEEYDLAKREKKLGFRNFYTVKTSLIHSEGVWPAPWIIKKLIYLNCFIKYIFKSY